MTIHRYLREAYPDFTEGTGPDDWTLRPDTRDVPNVWVHNSAVIDTFAVFFGRAIIGPRCVVDKNAIIGEDVTIYADCIVMPVAYIQTGVTLGDHTLVMPYAVISKNASLANRCTVHKNVVVPANTHFANDVVFPEGYPKNDAYKQSRAVASSTLTS